MTVVFRCRIEKKLLQKANRVAKRFGASTPELVRTLIANIAHTGEIRLGVDIISAISWQQRAEMRESFYNKGKIW